MKTLPLTALALAGAATLASLQAETKSDLLNRRDLADGTRVTASEAPFLVFLRISQGRRYFQCLGTMIARNWVATAAHCIDSAEYRLITATHISGGRQPSGIGRAPGEARSRDVQIHLHPNWRHEYETWDDVESDIALLKLPTPFPRSKGPPARLPTAAESTTIQPGLTVRTIGRTPEFRQAARADWPLHEDGSPRASIIAIRTDSAHTEPGDSGGPTLLQIGQDWVLIGITSGGSSEVTFGPSTSYHRDWITATLNGTEPPSPPPSTTPITPEPQPGGKITLTLETEGLTGLTCTVRTSDGGSVTAIGYSGTTTFSWNLSGPFRRGITIDCE